MPSGAVLRTLSPPASYRAAAPQEREQAHERILAFSGSKIGVEPTTSTVTGYCSPMYSTASSVPAVACSDGRYDMRTYFPMDGAAPALVTYERRPFSSVIGEPS